MSTTTDTTRQDKAALDAELDAAGVRRKGKAIYCPFHEDRHPSGSTYRDHGGAWKYKCHGCGFCGDVFDVRAKRTGRPLAEVLREASGTAGVPKAPSPPAAPPKVYGLEEIKGLKAQLTEAVHLYHDPRTRALDMGVIRWRDPETGEKKFTPFHPHCGGYVIGAPPTPRPIYNRSRLQDADPVLVVEGELCVETLQAIGIVSTTSPGGCKAGHLADWRPLAGKTVYLWPDADPPGADGKCGGVEHMRAVARILGGLTPPARLWWIDPKPLALPPKGDVVDYLARFNTDDEKRAAIAGVLQSATSMGAAAGLKRRLDAIVDGRFIALRWPWAIAGQLTQALLPGSVTLLCGPPDSGKSFLLLQAATYWLQEGIRLALYELEETRDYHLHRVLAQLERNAELTDTNWAAAHGEEILDAYEEHADFLDRLGQCIVAAPQKQPTLTQVAEWIEGRAAAGAQIIAVDPVTVAQVEGKQWEADKGFLARCKSAIVETGARLILVTHPRKGYNTKAIGLDEMAGGAAYGRFCQTAFWIQHYEPPKEFRVRTALGITTADCNASVRILKARNGPGGGMRIGYTFLKAGLLFHEHGIVVTEGKL